MERNHLRAPDLWSGLVLAALGTYIVAEAREWEYLGPDGPGPGFFPLWYGVAITVLSAVLVVSSALRKRNADRVDWASAGRAVATWLALAIAVAAFKLVGFLIGFAALTLFIVAVMYRRPLAIAAVVALTSAAGFYLAFPLALDVPLPVGVLGF
jgi:putative tricarboxylic transport membrane protein